MDRCGVHQIAKSRQTREVRALESRHALVTPEFRLLTRSGHRVASTETFTC
jgi:hypothetical protein